MNDIRTDMLHRPISGNGRQCRLIGRRSPPKLCLLDMLLTLAYPKLESRDKHVIAEFRREHDSVYADVVDAHWTMIFPSSSGELTPEEMAAHVSEIASRNACIEFVCRYALVYDDDSNEDYYIFLVPDEGFSAISLLHDDLYSGFMRSRLRLDIPYVPHIGIATHKDKDKLYEIAKEWNSFGREIRGAIDTLTLGSYDGKRVENLKHFKLGAVGK